MNYLIFRASAREQLSYDEKTLQYIPSISQHLGEHRIECRHLSPPKQVPKPIVVHCCGVKPRLQYPRFYSRPFTAFRLMHYLNVYGHNPVGKIIAWLRIWFEEAEFISKRLRRRVGMMSMPSKLDSIRTPVLQQ